MKKTLALLLTALMLFPLAACAQPAPAAEEAPAAAATKPPLHRSPAQQDVTLTFMAAQDWVQDAELALAEKFTQETGISRLPDRSVRQYPNLLQTKLNSGECTDIFCSQAGRFDIVTT